MISRNAWPAEEGGFSLVELMTVLAIVGIMFTIVIPGYQDHMVKTRRAEAKSCLLEMAQVLERRYAVASAYEGAQPGVACLETTKDFYTYLPEEIDTVSTFSLSAEPTSVQDDSVCGTLSIDSSGAKSITGSGSLETCW